MKKSDMLEVAASIHEYLVRGRRDTYIMEKLGLDSETYEECKKLLLETKAEEVRNQPREHYFVAYSIEQRRNIKDLDDLIKNLDSQSQYNAVVGAIRLRADIVDRIVNRAQEFGLVKKEAERKELIGGIVVAQLGPDDLRKEIIKQTKMMAEVIGKYGEVDLLSLPPKPLHYGPSVVETSSEPAATDDEDTVDDDDDEASAIPEPTLVRPLGPRAKTSKRSAGRKRAR